MKLKKILFPFISMPVILTSANQGFASGTGQPFKAVATEQDSEKKGDSSGEISENSRNLNTEVLDNLTEKEQEEAWIRSRMDEGYRLLPSDSECSEESEDSFADDLQLQYVIAESLFGPGTNSSGQTEPVLPPKIPYLLNYHEFFGLYRPDSGFRSQPFRGQNRNRESGIYRPGLRNLGNTCFANATTTLLFESAIFGRQLERELEPGKIVTLPGESGWQLVKRQEFQKAAAKLKLMRDQKEENSPRYRSPWDIETYLSQYLTALEEASLSLDGTRNIGGFDGARLRRNQGDAFDFASRVMEYLEYPDPGWVKRADFEDGSVKRIAHPGSGIISLNLKNFREELKDVAGFSLIFRENTRGESMTGNNQIENQDGVKMDSVMTYGFLDLPDSAIFRLERFEWDYTMTEPGKIKIMIPVRMEKTVRLRSFAGIQADYTLRGVVIHSGPNPSFGHYYAYIWDSSKETWLIYDDASVRVVAEETVAADVEKNGYLFLYDRAENPVDSPDIL